MRQQTPPLSIQIEFTEGCNLLCGFCGLSGMREQGSKDFRFMTKETATRIVSMINWVGWNSRIIISMHGEPTLNPNSYRLVSLFRKALPNTIISMMTNGYGIVHAENENAYDFSIHENVASYMAHGLNDLIVDYYSKNGDAAKIEKTLNEVIKQGFWKDLDIQHLDSGVPLYGNNSKKFRVLFNPPIQTEGAINRHLCNHCGAAAPLDYSYEGKRCARPFRELSIRYDGSVALCCNDFRGEYPIGNINEVKIDELWNSKRFEAARILLYSGERTFKPCLGCNALSHRVGLLPDRMGKDSMPKPTDVVRAYAKKVSEHGPLSTSIVKRRWE